MALDAEGHFVRKSVSGRYLDETQEYPREMFDYMDVFHNSFLSLKFICNWSESNDEIQSILKISTEQLHLFLIID